MQTPRVINDHLSVAQLQEQIKKFVKQEIRRRDGAIADVIPDVAEKHRFVQPYRISIAAASDTSLNNTLLVAFFLMAGPKPLHVKRIFTDFAESKGAGTGSNAHRMFLRRFTFAPIVQLATITSSSFIHSVPQCLTNALLSSTAATAVSCGASALTTNSTFLGAAVGENMGGIALPSCNTSAAVRRLPAVFEWRNDNDSDLFVIPPMTGIWIENIDTATGSLWPAGFIEWEE